MRETFEKFPPIIGDRDLGESILVALIMQVIPLTTIFGVMSTTPV